MTTTASVVLQTVEGNGLVFQTRIEVVHRLRGRDLDPRAIEDAIRLSDTKYCSVHASLAPSVEILSRFEIIPA